MPRKPAGDRAMTSAERQRRYLANLVRSQQTAAPAPVVGPVVNLDHLVRWPDRVVPWLVDRLGRDAALKIADRMIEAAEALPETEPPPDET